MAATERGGRRWRQRDARSAQRSLGGRTNPWHSPQHADSRPRPESTRPSRWSDKLGRKRHRTGCVAGGAVFHRAARGSAANLAYERRGGNVSTGRPGAGNVSTAGLSEEPGKHKGWFQHLGSAARRPRAGLTFKSVILLNRLVRVCVGQERNYGHNSKGRTRCWNTEGRGSVTRHGRPLWRKPKDGRETGTAATLSSLLLTAIRFKNVQSSAPRCSFIKGRFQVSF